MGILLQRTWSDLRVRVYIAYSGAFLAGASSLLLVSFLVLYLSVLRVQAASYLDTWVSNAVILWLLVNIGLTAFFLFRSLRYLTPVVQQQSLLQYTAKVLWPRELERRLLQMRWQSAPVIGWPPNENELDQAVIGPSIYGLTGSCTEVAHTSQSTKWLADVRVWPLLWVAVRWKRRIPPDLNAQSVWLTFPVVFKRAIKTGDDFCRRTGGTELKPLEKFFVRHAFKVTTTAPDRAHLDLASVMDELGDAALSSINDGRVNSFSRALSNLLEFHRIAIQLGSYSVGVKIGNYLEMANNPVGSMQTLHGRLLDPYRELAQHAIDFAGTDIGPLHSAAHSTDALLSHVREEASLEVREQLLFIAGFQWGAFRSRRHRTIGLGSQPANSDDLAARKSETEIVDAKVARTLCSAWDSIAFQILRQDDLRGDWTDLAQRGKECVHFLEKTTNHILVAVADNDALVGRWALDLIQRWTGNWFPIIEEHASWEEFPQISEGVLELSWTFSLKFCLMPGAIVVVSLRRGCSPRRRMAIQAKNSVAHS